MTSSQLNLLFDNYSAQEAEDICNAALATRSYKVKVWTAVTAVFMTPLVLALLAFFAMREYSPTTLVRMLVALLVLLSMFLAFRLIFPINDRLVDRAITKELARRGNRSAV